MRENRLSGSEGGATVIPSSLPLSMVQSLRDKGRAPRCSPYCPLATLIRPKMPSNSLLGPAE